MIWVASKAFGIAFGVVFGAVVLVVLAADVLVRKLEGLE